MPEPASIAAFKLAKDGIDVLDKMGALESVLLKLKSSPDKAAIKLTQALSELNLGYTLLHNELLELGSLSYSTEELRDTQKRLKALQSGKLRAELAAVKGNCSRIQSIYYRYLTGWFDRVLTKVEAARIRRLFFDLGHMDGKFLRSADALSDIAQKHAAEVLVLLQAKNTDQATRLTQRLELKLLPLTEQLSNYMVRLWDLQTKFIAITRAL
jgi:hypothetical protein